MTTGIDDEFSTVDLVMQSAAATGAIDAFALSVIKAERQVRRLFTHTVFQCPAFDEQDVPALRQALSDNTLVYFEGFIAGLDLLWPITLSAAIGPRYASLLKGVEDSIQVRNKIFHGQLTDRNLSRADLLEIVAQLRAWCREVARVGEQVVGYDGFGRNSFRKGPPELAKALKRQLTSVNEYRGFLRGWVQRRR